LKSEFILMNLSESKFRNLTKGEIGIPSALGKAASPLAVSLGCPDVDPHTFYVDLGPGFFSMRNRIERLERYIFTKKPFFLTKVK